MLTRESLINGAFLKAHESLLPEPIRWSQQRINASLCATLDARPLDAPIWLFAYGSLIWNPLLEIAEAQPASLKGWQRRFCIRLVSGRATQNKPGRMLALEPGGSVQGVAYRLSEAVMRDELMLVWIREMVAGFYRPVWQRLELANGETVQAIVFVSDPDHPMYEADSTVATVAPLVSSAEGDLGSNAAYVHNLQASLLACGVHDEHVNGLARALTRPQ
jgi:glutathione-specific gamma-glutamylcyclotransferase